MAHFAKLDENNVVIAVYPISNAVLDFTKEEQSGIEFLTNWSGGYTNWKQTSYNNNFRKQYAGVGFIYDDTNDVFLAPQPFTSWSLDSNFDWQPPKPKPTGAGWVWNEETGEWING